VLNSELSKAMELAGDVAVQLARNTAIVFEDVQAVLDDVLPGPPLEAVLNDLRCGISSARVHGIVLFGGGDIPSTIHSL
jgi:hypothetical protein